MRLSFLSILVIGSLIIKTGKHQKGQVKYNFIAADCTVFNKRDQQNVCDLLNKLLFLRNEGWAQHTFNNKE